MPKGRARSGSGEGARSGRTGLGRWDAEVAGDRGSRHRGRSSGGGRRLPAEARRWAFTLVVLAACCVACVVAFTPLDERITQGLDIRGGVSVTLTATKPDGSDPTAEELASATSIVQSRVNSLGASEATVQSQGTNSVLVQIPGATDAQKAVETIGQTGHLEFVRLDEIGDADALARIDAGQSDVPLAEGTYSAFLDGSAITSVSVAQSSNAATGEWVVNVSFDPDGTAVFAEVTQDLAATHGRIAIVLDGRVQSAPAVQQAITDGNVSISGGFTDEEARSLRTVLESGSLPVTLTYSESHVVGPTLGQDSLRQGVVAIAVGAAVVVAYLFAFYRGLGLLTLGSLVVFTVVYLGLLAALSRVGAFALTLPGLAGMVLTVGMAADSSILVLERFREEIRMGRSVRAASVSGVRHGIGTSVDADVVTLVSALALFFVASGSVKGFGLTLALGIACDLVTMFLFKAPLLRLLARGAIQANPRLWGVDADLAEAARAGSGGGAKGGAAHA